MPLMSTIWIITSEAKVYGYAQPSSPRWHRSTAVSGYTGPFRHRGGERAWRDASSAIRSDQWEGWNFDRHGNSTVEGIWFKSGDLARFANGVRSLAGACAHTFAKGSAFQSRLPINIALVRITERARELVLRLASVLWRLRRATSIETAIFKSVTAEPGKVEHGHSRPTLVEAAELSDQNQLHLLATRQSDAAAGNELSFDAKRDIADGFLRLAALPTFALALRYRELVWSLAPSRPVDRNQASADERHPYFRFDVRQEIGNPPRGVGVPINKRGIAGRKISVKPERHPH